MMLENFVWVFLFWHSDALDLITHASVSQLHERGSFSTGCRHSSLSQFRTENLRAIRSGWWIVLEMLLRLKVIDPLGLCEWHAIELTKLVGDIEFKNEPVSPLVLFEWRKSLCLAESEAGALFSGLSNNLKRLRKSWRIAATMKKRRQEWGFLIEKVFSWTVGLYCTSTCWTSLSVFWANRGSPIRRWACLMS